jgi:hypothetical protein
VLAGDGRGFEVGGFMQGTVNLAAMIISTALVVILCVFAERKEMPFYSVIGICIFSIIISFSLLEIANYINFDLLGEGDGSLKSYASNAIQFISFVIFPLISFFVFTLIRLIKYVWL